MREEQVDKSDGDGRQILEDETDQPVVSALRDAAQKVRDEHLVATFRTHIAKPDVRHQWLTSVCEIVMAK